MAKQIIFILIVAIFLFNCERQPPVRESARVVSQYIPAAADSAFLDTLQHRSFLYFIHETNPLNGLVKDRSTEDSPASIAAVGFAFPVWAIGAERKWIPREDAAWRTLTALRFFWRAEQSPDPLATGYQGFYYHFLDMKTGKRVWNCELSTVDTGWLIAGIRFAAQYFNRENAEEREIRLLADSLTHRVKWDWMTMPDTGRYASTITMGWRPEEGFHHMGWVGYNEALLIYIIAAGSNYRGATKAYQQWLSHYDWRESYPGLAHAVFPPLFGHQWSQMFVDFRGLWDDFGRKKGIDYFENSRRATLTQWRYAIDNPRGWAGYDSLIWGLTAGDGPGETYNAGGHTFLGYAGRGSSGPELVFFDDGTIAPTAAASSIVFAPEIVFPTLHAMYNRYGEKGLWGPYGFRDGFNPTAQWWGEDYLGIDQGPIVIMIENYRSGLVWKLMMQDPVIRKGLEVLGFSKTGILPVKR